MKQITEVSRRSMYHEDYGMACGPVSSASIVTEIVVDVDGKYVYLHGEWVDLAGDDYYFEATAESLYDAFEKMNNATDDKAFQDALAERDRIGQGCIQDDSLFGPFYEEMKQMIHREMDAHGIGFYHEDADKEQFKSQTCL